jgi:GrpB-like predicted nucleotidyltransferase (UPF0157 family)
MADMRSVTAVEQVPHDMAWEDEYRRETNKIRKVLGDEIVEAYHIGSTPIPGITAKPIIDILIGVSKIEDIDRYNDSMAGIGYEARGEYGLPGRRFFVKGVPKRTHNVHIFQAGSLEIIRHANFRDYMIAHPEDARKYGELKRKLAEQFPYDIEAYCDGKDAFVKEMERRAMAWAKGQ